MNNTVKIALGALAIIAIIAVPIVAVVYYANTPGPYDDFAACLGEKGATFYGAYWCPHCQEQKAIFKKSAPLLPYVECSTPDGKGQLDVCINEEVQSYPTWKFADGEVMTGVLSLETLAAKTSCELPTT